MPSESRRAITPYFLAALSIAAATILRLLLNPLLDGEFPFATLFFAVLWSAWYGGLGTALAATAMGAVAAKYFLLEPPGLFSSLSAIDRGGMIVYLVVSSGIAVLGGQMRRARVAAETSERAVVEERQQLATTLRSIGDAVIVTDAAGLVSNLNPIAEELTGWTLLAAQGQPLDTIFRIVNEQTRRTVESPVAKVLREGTIVGLANHTVLIARDGSERPIDDSAAPIHDADGTLRGVVLVFRDVTDRRRADEANERLAAIVESSDDAIIAKTLDGAITNWNAGAERIYGYSAEEALGRPFSLLIPPDRAEEVKQLGERLRRGERLDHFETVRQRKDGRRIEVSVSYSPIQDHEGLVTGIAVITRDISDRKRRESLQQLQLALTVELSAAQTLQPATDVVLRRVVETLHWDVAAVWLVDREEQRLRCFAVQAGGPTGDAFRADCLDGSLAPDEGLPGRAWRAGDCVWVSRLAAEPWFSQWESASKAELQSGAAYPMTAEGRVVGVIELLSREERELDPDLLQIGRAVAGQLGQFFERIAAQENLRKSEQDLSDFFENATVGLHWVGPDGTILRVNQAELEMLGYSRDEYVGRNIQDFHAEPSIIQGLLHRLEAGEHVHDCAARLRCRDGSIKDVIIDSSVLWEGERFVHTRCFTRDVTERRAAEDALRRQERQLRLVSDNAPVYIAHCDREHRFKFVNRAYAERFGLAPEDLLGRTISDVLGESAFASLGPYLARVLSGERVVFEVEVPYRQLGPLHMLCAYAPETSESGDVIGHVAAVTNITERRRAEQHTRFLADASAALGTVIDVDSTLSMVARLSVPAFADWCVVDILEADDSLRRVAAAHADPQKLKLAEDLHRRYPTGRDAGYGVWKIVRTGEAELVEDINDEMLSRTIREADHLAMIREVGPRSYIGVPLAVRGRTLGVIRFLTSESGRRFGPAELAVARDLADRAAVAIENARLYEALRDADRRKDVFLAMLAHELRNPLAPMRNALEILKLSERDPAAAREAREIAERQVQSLSRMVDDLLDVSRIMQGKIELRRERVDLRTLLSRAVETARPTIDAAGHALRVRLPDEPLWTDADVVRIAQVISNLLHNAAKYTDAGGTITVEAFEDGAEAVVRVRDTGIGIDPAILPQVFEMFMQVDSAGARAQGGLGIGLTVVRTLVELHGGTVQARSPGIGLGSEFEVRLKRERSAMDQGGNGQASPGREGARRRVLIVDDNADAASTLAMLLRLSGHDARVARDGHEALSIAGDWRPELAFLDLGMPGMDGYELARRFRGEPDLARTVLVALTGWGQDEDRRRTRDAGFDAHEVKPIEPSRLERLLSELPVADGAPGG
ncbi:MAG: PAS domain S-box protein [Planctomyces sp.]|nr:PAS domain S-box protein [Planctomyces sp.]